MSRENVRQNSGQRPDPVDQLFAVALQRHKAGQFSEAERLYQEILVLEPKHIDSLHLAGVVAHQSGRNEAAVELIERAMEFAGPVSTFHNSMGEALRALGRYGEAADHFRQAVALEPDFYGAHLNLGSALKQEGKLADAVAQYKWVLALKPDYAEAHVNLGVALMDQSDLQEAEHHLRQALALMPNLVQAEMNLGIVAQKRHRLDEAIAHYERALTVAPDYVLALMNLGDALMELGRLDEAAGRYARALRVTTRAAEVAADLLTPVEAVQRMTTIGRPLHQLEDKGVMSLVRLACWQRPPVDWPAVSKSALTLPGMTAASRYELHVRSGIGQWLRDDEAALQSTLEQCTALDNAIEFANPNVTNSRAYTRYLRNLLADARAKPGARLQESALPVLAVVGDSHGLAYEGTQVALDGAPHVARARLVMGCKAFHLAQETPNRFTWLFERIAHELPADTPVLCSFGEIDCRLDDGIMRHYRKTGGDLDEMTRTLVERYVAAVVGMLGGRNIKPAFLSVPAPNFHLLDRSSEQPSEEDRELLVRIIRTFNEALEKAATAHGCRVVDLYRVSAGPDGTATGALHLDDHHLKPEALAQALG